MTGFLAHALHLVRAVLMHGKGIRAHVSGHTGTESLEPIELACDEIASLTSAAAPWQPATCKLVSPGMRQVSCVHAELK